MIACIIEFTIRPGMEMRHREVLEPLLKEIEGLPGFISKETFESRATPGRLLTISYWEDREAIKVWMANANHRKSMVAGKRDIFANYMIRIAPVEREYEFPRQRAASAAPDPSGGPE
jgi:heme-degrading monooxygenase HmoA